ncbi:hypothetical protein ANCDUO_24952, partial [Ancylostoma duodenale]
MAAAANLLALRDFTLILTWPELEAKTKEEFDERLADRGSLWKERPCPNCGIPREVDEKNIVQWTQWFRDVLVDYYAANVTRIGGPNTVVQVDETHIVRRKYNVDRIVRRDWLVGGIQDGTKLVFVEITDDRSSANLDAIIQRHVMPRGVVRTDMWRGYSNLTNLGYVHET